MADTSLPRRGQHDYDKTRDRELPRDVFTAIVHALATALVLDVQGTPDPLEMAQDA